MDEHEQKPPPLTIVVGPPVQPEEIRHSDGRIEHPRVQREETDIRFRGIAAAVIVIGASLAAVASAARVFLHEESVIVARRADHIRSSTKLDLPKQPRLEALQAEARERSFAASAAAAELRLHQYGPTDDPGFVHIPIEKAIQKLAGDLQSQEPPLRREKSFGLIGGGESNSGRLFREAPP